MRLQGIPSVGWHMASGASNASTVWENISIGSSFGRHTLHAYMLATQLLWSRYGASLRAVCTLKAFDKAVEGDR